MEAVHTRRSNITLVAIFLLLIGLAVGVALIQHRQDLRQKATGEAVLEILPSATTVTEGNEFDLNIKLNTNTNNISDAKLTLYYSKDNLQALSITKTSVFSDSSNINIDQNNGEATITLTTPLTTPFNGSDNIATIKFKALTTTASAQVYFAQSPDTSLTDVSGNAISYSTIPAEVVISRANQEAADTILAINPTTKAVSVASDFSVDLNINTGANSVISLDLYINYDDNLVTGVDIVPNTDNTNNNKFTFLKKDNGDIVTKTIGSGQIHAVIIPQQNFSGFKGADRVATIFYKAKNINGTSPITIADITKVGYLGGSGNAMKAKNDGTVTISGATVAATPTPQPTATPSSNNNNNNSSGGTGGAPVCTNAVPNAPLNLKAVVKDANTISLSWAASANTTYYGINYGLSSGNYIMGADNVGNVTSYSVRGLTAGRTYYFVVFANNGCARSKTSNEASVKTITGGSSDLANNILNKPPATPNPDPLFKPLITNKSAPELISKASPENVPQLNIPASYGQKKGVASIFQNPLNIILGVLVVVFVVVFFVRMKM